jgi:mRNA interferase MazF
MATILRGDIRWADLNPVIGSEQGGLRPVLVLSHNVFNERSGTVIAVAITSQSQRAGFPLTMELHDQRLPKKSWVKISQIRTLSVKRIGKKMRMRQRKSSLLLSKAWTKLLADKTLTNRGIDTSRFEPHRFPWYSPMSPVAAEFHFASSKR